MRLLKNSLITMGACLWAAMGAQAVEWSTDPDAAMATATAEQRIVFLEFTGSGWCPPCMYLQEHIFPTAEFEAYIREKNPVLVELDFPRDTTGISREQWKQRENWRVKYKVENFPRIVVTDGRGYPYAVVKGACPKTEDYLKRIDAALAQKAQIEHDLAEARKLSGVERAKALVKALEVLNDDRETPGWHLMHVDVVDEVIANDPDDVTGYRKTREEQQRLTTQLAELVALGQKYSGRVDRESQGEAMADALAMLERTDLVPVVRLHLYKFVSDSYALRGDAVQTLRYLRAAVNAAPDTHEASRLRPWLENLERNMPESEKQKADEPVK